MTWRESQVARVGDYCDEESFTKWLAGRANLEALDAHQPYHDQLGRTIGVELWNLRPEVPYDGEYDGYRADIVARGYDGERFVDVVVEAQFDRNKTSALNHLGKLIHYGNLADADVLVWLTDAELDSRIYETVAWLAPQTRGLDLQVVETSVRSNAGDISIPKTRSSDGTVAFSRGRRPNQSLLRRCVRRSPVRNQLRLSSGTIGKMEPSSGLA